MKNNSWSTVEPIASGAVMIDGDIYFVESHRHSMHHRFGFEPVTMEEMNALLGWVRTDR